MTFRVDRNNVTQNQENSFSYVLVCRETRPAVTVLVHSLLHTALSHNFRQEVPIIQNPL